MESIFGKMKRLFVGNTLGRIIEIIWFVFSVFAIVTLYINLQSEKQERKEYREQVRDYLGRRQDQLLNELDTLKIMITKKDLIIEKSDSTIFKEDKNED